MRHGRNRTFGGAVHQYPDARFGADGNTINIRFIRPDGGEAMPCVYYIHGGGMQSGSFLQGNYRTWGKIIAARGVAVAMGFRNADAHQG